MKEKRCWICKRTYVDLKKEITIDESLKEDDLFSTIELGVLRNLSCTSEFEFCTVCLAVQGQQSFSNIDMVKNDELVTKNDLQKIFEELIKKI